VAAVVGLLAACEGTPDAGFGDGGKAIVDIDRTNDVGGAIARDAGGRVVIVGRDLTNTTTALEIARLRADGRLDTTFSGDGKRSLMLDGLSAGASSVAIQPDGRIIVAGAVVDRGLALVRFHPDGALDRSFGDNGWVTTIVGDDEFTEATDVAVQPDGKIVVAGRALIDATESFDFVVARYMVDGSLDRGFGDGDGWTTTDLGGDDMSRSVLIDSKGRVVVAGYRHELYQDHVAVARYTSTGLLDRSFGGDGHIDSVEGQAFDAVLTPKDRIVVAGGRSTPNVAGDHGLLARFDTDGTPDERFGGTDGVELVGSALFTTLYGLALQPDGAIVAAGTTSEGSGLRFSVMRFTTSGATDTRFGSRGTCIVELGVRGAAGAVVVQPDGKLLVSGIAGGDDDYFSPTRDFLVVRLHG
jgi:uncharacterized delta-60 repeat protein